MANIELPDFMSYKDKFSNSKFVEKIQRVAKRAGAKLVYVALILFYTLQSDKVSLKVARRDSYSRIGRRPRCVALCAS